MQQRVTDQFVDFNCNLAFYGVQEQYRPKLSAHTTKKAIGLLFRKDNELENKQKEVNLVSDFRKAKSRGD